MASDQKVPDVWMETLQAGAAINCPTILERIRDSRITPAAAAAICTFFILLYLQPQFVQRKQSSKVALPKLNYTVISIIVAAVFFSVLVVPVFM